MSAAQVKTILTLIQQLPEEDRILLEDELAQLTEKEWREQANEARRRAADQGLDQSIIDRAIEELRYPK